MAVHDRWEDLWAATRSRLANGRGQAFSELAGALRLFHDVPDAHRVAVSHWRGKVALLNNAIAEAIPQLALAASLQTQRAANHYLLGATGAPAAVARRTKLFGAALELQPALSTAP